MVSRLHAFIPSGTPMYVGEDGAPRGGARVSAHTLVWTLLDLMGLMFTDCSDVITAHN